MLRDVAELPQPALKRKPVGPPQRRSGENRDATKQNVEPVADSLLRLFRIVHVCGRIRHAPARRHRLPRPYLAHLPGRLITNRNHKIDGRHVRLHLGVVAALSVWWKKLSPDGRNANEVTSQAVADMGGSATFYDCLVEIERAGAS